ncbi:MAG: hypothetical protein H0W89_08325, partial [Candidatus Levybacteria bacterium]|nr:hypothetical protein [Candidatus Levybacteria bacterium]
LWALMAIAKEKGEEFEEGSFICKDENGICKDENGICKDETGNLTTFLIALASTRPSSHLKGVASAQHYGIDVVPTEHYFLPEHKRHVLLASIYTPELGRRIFIKPENFGVSTSFDALGHAVEYIQSLGRKMNPSLFGSDDAENYRKERVPQDLLKEFKDILNDLDEDVTPYNDAKKFGVSAMYKFTKERIGTNHLSHSVTDKMKQFQIKLEGMGNPEVRIGREVIIDNLEDICHKHFIEVASAS